MYRPPTQTCTICGDTENVRPDGRGFPPDIAARRLAKRCTAAGHTSQPRYMAGIEFARSRETADDWETTPSDPAESPPKGYQ